MLIIPVKEGENIDRALKRFKRKFDSTKTMRNLRERQQFNKPSVVNRKQKTKAGSTENKRQTLRRKKCDSAADTANAKGTIQLRTSTRKKRYTAIY